MDNVVNGAHTAVKHVDFSVVAATDYGACPIMEGDVSRSALGGWYLEGFHSLRSRELVQRNALRNIIQKDCVFFSVEYRMSSTPSQCPRSLIGLDDLHHRTSRFCFQDLALVIQDMTM